MSDLFPCPNPACTNWIPIGRDRCFRCGHTLSTDAAQARIDRDPEGHHPLLWPGVALAAILLIVGGLWIAHVMSVKNDADAPIVVVTDPVGDTVRSAKDRVEVVGSVTDKHPDVVEVDGREVEIVDGSFRATIEAGPEPRTVTIVARDKNGNASAAKTLTVSQDVELPEITALSPPDGSLHVTRQIAVTGTANEELATASVGSTQGTASGTTFSIEVPLQPGPNVLQVTVQDVAGNTSTRTLNVRLEERRLPPGIELREGVFVATKDSSSMVLVPEGTFPMGNAGGDADERPVHQVTVPSFLIDRSPITVRSYLAYLAATGGQVPAAPDFARDYWTAEEHVEKPAVNVSWRDARSYAEWAGRRLPTEAEWELAARGTEGRAYPWGNDPPAPTSGHANIAGAEDGHEATSPVGAFPQGATPTGIVDMAGNVWQWTLDFYDASFYASSPATAPEGPASGTQFTLRGGAFTSQPTDVRSTNRYPRGPDERARNVGFRTVADLP